MIRTTILLASFVVSLPLVSAIGQESTRNLSPSERQAALKEIGGKRQYTVFASGCRLSRRELGRFDKLSEAVAVAQKVHAERTSSLAWVLVGDPAKVDRVESDTNLNTYFVATSLRCGTISVVDKYSKPTEARAKLESFPQCVMVFDVGDAVP